MKPQHIPMTVPPIVFNERLVKHLRTLESGAKALALATKELSRRLDEREAKKGVPGVTAIKTERRYSTE